MSGKRNIVLTGFMGTGKTTVGTLLSRELGYDFIDTDELIVSRSGRSISDIFRKDGEGAFRRLEADLAVELAEREGLVLSTGGRMMLDRANADILEKSGRVFCLVATPEEILRRVSGDTGVQRPLLQVENPVQRVMELLEERKDGYGRFEQIDTSGRKPEDIAAFLAELYTADSTRIQKEL